MDLASGYWQVNMNPEDCEKCALITNEGLFDPSQMHKVYAMLLPPLREQWIHFGGP